MAASVVGICNAAIGHIGDGKPIASIEAQDHLSKTCRLVYEKVHPELLQSFDWGFARKDVALALLRDGEAPSAQFGLAYAEPGQCVRMLRLVSGLLPPDSLATIIPYETMNGPAGREIWTNLEEAVGRYTHLVTDPALFPPAYASALGWGMAVDMVPTLVVSGQRLNTTKYLEAKFKEELSKARTLEASTEQQNSRPIATGLKARF